MFSVLTKELSDMTYGVMSQCLLFKNMMKSSPATCSNIVLKLNAKLGGVNNQIEPDEVLVFSSVLFRCRQIIKQK